MILRTHPDRERRLTKVVLVSWPDARPMITSVYNNVQTALLTFDRDGEMRMIVDVATPKPIVIDRSRRGSGA